MVDSQSSSNAIARVAGPRRGTNDRLRVRQRSIRYHRPRAPFCGIGFCTGCLVRAEGRINVRACREGFPERGIRPTSHAWPTPGLDLFGVVDFLFPHGIDTLRGFRWPAWASPLYHRAVRRMAGYDRAPASVAPAVLAPPDVRRIDVAILGGGRSGSAVAASLRRLGSTSWAVVDRDLSTPAASPEILARTTAVFLPPPSVSGSHPFTILARGDRGVGALLRARSVVVATGGYDASLLFAGNDRPGVITGDAAFALGTPESPAFRRAVLFGAGERARQVLERFGASIVAIVAPGEIGPDLVRPASDLGIDLFPRSLLLSAIGRRRVRRVEIRGRSRGPFYSIPADSIVLAHRRLPHPQLFFQAGARMLWSHRLGTYVPALDGSGASSVPGLYAVGSAAGATSDEEIAAGAERVAAAIMSGSSVPSSPGAAMRDERPAEIEGYYRELLAERRGREKWIACACEDVLLDEIEDAERRGYRGIEVVKRYSGLGTGLCQGRYCLPDALIVQSIWEGRPPSEVGFITQRPPVVPTELGTLASLADALAPGETP